MFAVISSCCKAPAIKLTAPVVSPVFESIMVGIYALLEIRAAWK